MPRRPSLAPSLMLAIGCAWLAAPPTARAQAFTAPTTLGGLSRLTPAQLDALYRASPPGPVPAGRVRGRALIAPGTPLAGPLSAGSRLAWQGKVFNLADGTAVNRFFGVRAVRGRTYSETSWLDGRPSLILDYAATSRVYASNRDEIRMVAPNLYLGLMYSRTSPTPTLKMYFAFQATP